MDRTTVLSCIAVSFLLLSSNSVFAKTWYQKNCTATEVNSNNGTWYVGGTRNNYHMHVGKDFIHLYNKQGRPKLVTKNIANCPSIKESIATVDSGGYASPDDVRTCLNAAKTEYKCD